MGGSLRGAREINDFSLSLSQQISTFSNAGFIALTKNKKICVKKKKKRRNEALKMLFSIQKHFYKKKKKMKLKKKKEKDIFGKSSIFGKIRLAKMQFF